MSQDNNGIFIQLAGIAEETVVDGPGLRMCIFTQGCKHNCPGCHNPQTHGAGGFKKAVSEIVEIYKKNPLLSGITFSGGEPFLQPYPLSILAKKIHALRGNVVTYTGYVLDELLGFYQHPDILELLNNTDILIDGPYIESLRSLELPFRGSSNQRILKQCRRKITIGSANRADASKKKF